MKFDEQACQGCGEESDHPAHVEVWQIGGNWVPVCSDRVLDWWHFDSVGSYRERKEAGCPDKWIREIQ